MYLNQKISVIIAAAGSGSRMGGSINKQYICLSGLPMLARTVRCFEQHPVVDEIVIVTAKDETKRCTDEIVRHFAFRKVTKVTAGGAKRQDSVKNALDAIDNEDGYVVIHDGARPFVTEEIIYDAIHAATVCGAAAAGIPVKDTIKVANEDRHITSTPDRSKLYAIQTPQVFEVDLIREAFEKAYAEGFYGTDETVLIERMNKKVYISKGSYSNIKVTTPEDLKIGEALLQGQYEEDVGEVRSGLGYDVHALTEGRKLILGGVEIPHDRGLLGHSDADVLTHAIMDALLGAAGLGDIGRHFPDTDRKYEGISSLVLLSQVGDMLRERQWQVVNIDTVIAAQNPRLAPHITKMIENIAETLQIEINRINVKATTTERLGPEGREEGISAQAICNIQKGTKR